MGTFTPTLVPTVGSKSLLRERETGGKALSKKENETVEETRSSVTCVRVRPVGISFTISYRHFNKGTLKSRKEIDTHIIFHQRRES